MRWFRQHIRNGSWLALVAIAINLTLAFGHVHGLDGKVPERTGVLIAAIDASGSGPGQHHPADGHADYLCPICMAATAMGSALAPAPPTLPIEFAEASVDRPIDQFVSAPRPLRAAFQSRGPPIS